MHMQGAHKEQEVHNGSPQVNQLKYEEHASGSRHSSANPVQLGGRASKLFLFPVQI